MTDDGPKGPIDASNKRFMALLNQDGGPLTAVWLMMSVLTFVYAFLWAGIT